MEEIVIVNMKDIRYSPKEVAQLIYTFPNCSSKLKKIIECMRGLHPEENLQSDSQGLLYLTNDLGMYHFYSIESSLQEAVAIAVVLQLTPQEFKPFGDALDRL